MPPKGKRKRSAEECSIEEIKTKSAAEKFGNVSEESGSMCLPIVCNVKVAYLRPQYDNLFEWVKDQRNEYIGRGGVVFINGSRFPGKSSVWANPFKIGRDGSRAVVIRKCEEHLRNLLKEKPELVKDLMNLKGKNLGCWCVDASTSECDDHDQIVCHGQLLIKLIKEYQQERAT
jgi:hypothetical protein